jgi:amino acid adenylation domain-containing protein
MMEPVLVPFTELLRKIKFGEPQIPYVSNVTARWITAAEAKSPEYWAGHVRQTVRFADGVAELMKDSKYVLLEVGPGQTLSTLARQHPSKASEQTVLASLAMTGDQEPHGLLDTLGRLWMNGVSVDWQQFYADERRLRAVLPTYPFERKRYWPESAPTAARGTTSVAQFSTTPVMGNGPTTPNAELQAAQPVAVSAQAATPAEPALPRKDRLLVASRTLLEELSGYDLSQVDPATSLLELGLDSLLLTQAAQVFHRKFGVSITFRQLMEELGSLQQIAEHLDATLPAEAFAPRAAPAPVAAAGTTQQTVAAGNFGTGNIPNSILEQILQQQQALTQQVLQLMGRAPSQPAATSSPVSNPIPAAATTSSVPMVVKSEVKSHGPFKPIDRAADMAMSAEQTAALKDLIARYTSRTAESKKLAIKNRPILADPRSVGGFKQLWKDMVYPIFTTRSDGSKVWDVDGNEYVDFVMGFGASIFGHRPPFVVEAVKKQLDLGFEIGPIQPIAGEVAELVREFTGMQRVAFTNTGSEAVLAATRVARTVTGRDKIAVFAGAYHGIFDEVLFRPLTVNGETRTAASAPGVPASAVSQVIVLDYGNPQSLDILRARGSEIAAVLVEPVQSRRLDLQPREFLHELRKVTKETGSALVFDEVVTGFRVEPGGAQAYFGVRADLATYGKVIGGGISIGAVTGDPKYMDALDGGQWNYGDTSFPQVGVTFFAGTFVRHPLALAAAKAVLLHLKEMGPDLQKHLTARTARLADQLRAIIDEFQAPYHISQFSSLMQLTFPSEQKYAALLHYMLRQRGIHIWDNRAFVLTTAHSEADLTKLLTAFRESLKAMVDAGFLPPPNSGSRKTSTVKTQTADTPAKERQIVPVAAGPGGVDQFPLTEAQKEIWLAAQMGGDAAVGYNESLKLEFRGAFDAELFRVAVSQVIQRHPILLASFSPDGQWERVDPNIKLEIPLTDLSAKRDSEREHELDRVIEREVSDSFDLAVGPLVRVGIVRMASEHHVVIWTAHHIICDGWSGGIVVNELATIYSSLKQGVPPVLDVPSAFRDYARSTQRDTPEAAEAITYWREQFADLPAPLDLPTDHSRPLIRTARASTLKRDFDQKLQQTLKRVAGQQRTTLVVLLMAGLNALLHRLTGQTDTVIGLGVAGQAMSDQSCLVGHCVNLLPIRTKIKPDTPFQENLAVIKKRVLDAYDHHQTTVGEILQHIAVPRSLGRPPLIEVIFNMDRDVATAQFHGAEFSCERNPKRALNYDLFFNFVDGPRGLYVECDYNTDLFDASTIERWLKHYQTLLQGIAVNPAETFAKLPILTDSEQTEITTVWNNGVEFPKQTTLHGWFEQQTTKTPAAHALTFEGKHFTYTVLNRRANQLAHHLRGLGVRPGALVGLFVERSFEMVVGILGILKAGGAYLPIDPVYPKDRLSFMLEDAGAPILLTHSSLAVELPEHQMKVVYFDKDSAELDREPETNPKNIATPDDLAYVIYTSGSTGKPKGTRVTHYNVVRLMQATEKWYQFNETDVWTFFHSHAFDFSVWELWGALLYGGRVVMVPYLTSRSPEEFYELLVSEGVTVLNQTPSAFKQFMQAEARLDTGQKLALRYVIFGGEALEMQNLAAWFERHGDQNPKLVNMYGITETTVHVTYRPLSAADLNSGSVIGVPIPDLQIYILDAYKQPVPIGVIGEIYVGGAGVAAGYLNREELTRQKFLPDTFRNEPGSLLYRTGDLARYLPSRDIEYFGRIDHQVKIRGFRIELGEIESVLAKHPAVTQCVVIAREETPGERTLVAYFEAQGDVVPDVSELRAHLKKEIPDYMVPSTFIRMDKLPLTPNGKIDLQALPAPEGRAVEIKETFLAPRDSVEQVLAQLWAKALKVKRVGLNDNFFDLGGHSLLAVRIIVEIENIYGRRLPLATLLQAPTVGALAEVLRKENWKPSWSSLVPLQPGGSKPPLFLIHSHGGNVLEYYPLANHLDKDQPVYALQARGLDGNIPKNESLEQIASAYLKEIRTLQSEGPYFLGGFCFGGLVALEAAQQLQDAGQKVALVVMIQTTHPGAPAFAPGSSSAKRWWHRTAKRIDLERDNLLQRGFGYFGDRLRRTRDVMQARTQIAFDKKLSNGNGQKTRASMAYILELLGMEHDRAFMNYVPRPYSGDVLLFRASEQLPGMLADRSLGWKPVIKGHLEIRELPGHQQNILVEPRVMRLAEELQSRLHPHIEEAPRGTDTLPEPVLVE